MLAGLERMVERKAEDGADPELYVILVSLRSVRAWVEELFEL